MNKAIQVEATGGPDVLKFADKPLGEPQEGQVLLRHTAIGLNFIDVYFRTGLYPPKDGFPFTPGLEAAGIVEAVGDGVSEFEVGDRVAYCTAMGAYSQKRLIDAAQLVPIPDGVDDKTAAAIMLKGLTVHYLMVSTYEVAKETVLLFHAAAGGVGQIAGQFARHIGATAIGTAGSQEKCDLALDNGYAHAVNYETEDFKQKVLSITKEAKCDVVYDSIGKDTFEASLECLKPRGLMVSFGNASGPVTGVDLAMLSSRGSLYVTRPSLFHYVADRQELLWRAKEMFSLVASGELKIAIGQTYDLANVGDAHRDLEARKTTGATVLLP